MSAQPETLLPGVWDGPMDNPMLRAEEDVTFHATTGAYLRSLVSETLHTGPAVDIYNYMETAQADVLTRKLSPEEANDKFGIEGELKFSEPIGIAAARMIRENKDGELARREVLSRSPGTGTSLAGIPVSMAASMLDPANLALTFVPVVGEEQILARFGKAAIQGTEAAMAGKNAATVGSRLLTGGVAGVEFTVPGEFMRFYTARQQHTDRDMNDSLKNIGFGFLLGAGFHIGAGILHDFAGAGPLAKEFEAYRAEMAVMGKLRPETREAMLRASIAEFREGQTGFSAAEIAALDHNLHLEAAANDSAILTKYADVAESVRKEFVKPLEQAKALNDEARAVLQDQKIPRAQILQRIAKDNGIVVEPKATSDEILLALRRSAATPEQRAVMDRIAAMDEARRLGPERHAAIELRKQQMRDEIQAKAESTTNTMMEELKGKILERQKPELARNLPKNEPLSPVNEGDVIKQEGPGQRVGPEEELAHYEKETNQRIADGRSLFSEQEMQRLADIDERIVEIRSDKKIYEAAADCVLRSFL